jgi:hypothetical protein
VLRGPHSARVHAARPGRRRRVHPARRVGPDHLSFAVPDGAALDAWRALGIEHDAIDDQRVALVR